MRAVAYLRLSKDDGTYGIEAQRAAIEKWAREASAEVALWCVDEGVSGDTPPERRKGLSEAIRGLSRGDILVVARRDRLARDLLISIALERTLAKMGVQIVSADGSGNGDSPQDELMRNMLGSVAQFEKSLIRMRTKAALERARSQGKRIGALGVEHTKPDVVAKIQEMRAAGLGYKAIAQQLNVAGVKTARRDGHAWHATTVKRILARCAKPESSDEAQ